MNKLSKEKQQQLIAVAFGAVVVIGLLYFFVIRAQGKSRAGKLAEIATAQEGVDKGEKLKKDTPKIQAELDEIKSKLDSMEKNMASGDLYSWVILTMNEFKNKNGHKVDIQNISREERVGISLFGDFPYDAVRYQVKVSAYYHDFGKFLANLENAFPYSRVQNLDMHAEAGLATGPEAEKLSYKFELVVPVKPKDK